MLDVLTGILIRITRATLLAGMAHGWLPGFTLKMLAKGSRLFFSAFYLS